MATQGYSGSVDLISGIRPKNSGAFPLVDAHDVYVAGPDKRLDTALTEKADKSDTYTQSEVDTKIASVQTFSKSIVDTLPEAASADDKTIYLVPRTNSETPDLCDEYVVVEESDVKRWERIGGTTVDVDGKRDIDDLAIYTMAPWVLFGSHPAFTWDESKNAWSATDLLSSLGYAIPEGSVLSYDKTAGEWKVTVSQSGQNPKVYTVTAPNDYAGLSDRSLALSLTITNVEAEIEGMEPDTRDVPITRSTAGLVATSQKLATTSQVSDLTSQVSGLTSQVSGLTSQISDKRDKTDLTVYDTPVDWYYDGDAVFVWDGENRRWRGESAGVMGSTVGNTYLEYDESAGEWLWWRGGFSGANHISAPESTLSLDVGGYTITRSTPHVPFGTKLATTVDLSMKASPMVSLTWAELKALRDGGTLVPGMRYRITDYETTCNGKAASDVLSSNDAVQLEDGMASVAGAVGLTALPFDIIVTADSESVLNENAQATARARHNYANKPNFAAWRLSYCLDNDASRFTWADTTNGKGVIYRLVDEWGNDCPYDFKNIVFRNRGGALSADDLIHRWSFNNSLEDTGSIGGMTARLMGNASLMITDADSGHGCARVNAGDPGTSWVELGANPIPTSLGNTPFTIEVWATPTEIRNYASIFALGNPDNTRAFGLMGVFNGYRQSRRESDAEWGVCWQALGAPMIVGMSNYSVETNVAVTSGQIAVDTPYYFAFVVNPVDNGYPEQIVDPATTITGYVYNAQTGELVGKSMTYTATTWAPDLMVQSAFNLGTTPWNNANPGADYDEVRVWKQALTPEQIADNVKAGPNTVPDVWRYTFTNPSGGDTSLTRRAAGNVVEMCTVGTGQCLNRVVFTGSVTVDNKLGRGCAAIYSFGQTRHNTFGSDSACLVLGSDCLRNSFGPYTRNCSFGDGTYRSRTGSSCSGITTEFQCEFDIGSHCYNIYLDQSCRGVTIGSECSEIRIGVYVQNTTVGNGCQNIELGFLQYSFRSIEFAPNTQNVKLRYASSTRREADEFVQHIDVSGFSSSTWIDVAVKDFLQTRRTSFVPGADGNGVVSLEYPTQSGTLMVAGS